MDEPIETQNVERRFIPATDVTIETREKDGAKTRVMRGYAAKFNTLSDDLGGFRERIAPGAFTRTITEDDIRALKNHNSDMVLGRCNDKKKKKTLRLSEDSIGLSIECDLPNTSFARDLEESMNRGDVDQMSFGFMVRWYPDGTRGSNWTFENGEDIRTLTDVILFDVSPVTFPAYPDTSCAMRSLDEFRKQRTTNSSDSGSEIDGNFQVSINAIAEEDAIYQRIKGL